MGNPWIAEQRAVFKDEVEAHKTEIAAMLLSEGDALQTCESLLNRCLLMRASGHPTYTLMQMLHSGFYGPISRQGLPRLVTAVNHSGQLAHLFSIVDQVMAGSDTIEGFTDQGLPTDPNGWRKPRLMFSGNVYNDWDGGPGHVKAEAWRQEFEGNSIKALQEALNAKELPVTVDGVMGPATESAVRIFQRQSNLEADGVAGDETWAALLAPAV